MLPDPEVILTLGDPVRPHRDGASAEGLGLGHDRGPNGRTRWGDAEASAPRDVERAEDRALAPFRWRGCGRDRGGRGETLAQDLVRARAIGGDEVFTPRAPGDSSLRTGSSAGAIRESGGTIRVQASGLGTPSGESTVTSASPIPSDVSASSTSWCSVIGNVRAVLRRLSASFGVNARSACCTRLPSWLSTGGGTSVGAWLTKRPRRPSNGSTER